jgi:formylglycine-generating enzyme required for sulfatase activity
VRRVIFTALFVIIGVLVFSQERIAVFPFEDRNNVFNRDELDSFYREFTNEFRNKTDDSRFTVIPRQELAKIIDMESDFQLSDYSSKVTAIASGNTGGQTPANMVRVEGGTFQMGTASGGEDRERPVHTVTVKSFYMSKYEVTQKEWYEVMGTTLHQQRDMGASSWLLFGEGDNYPMYYVNWYEAVDYCNRRSLKEGLTPVYRGSGDDITYDWNANGYRLQTDAEWQFAARGGIKDYLTTTYSGSNYADAVAWWGGNSNRSSHPVGVKAPNSLGIYDMSGNVREWCWSWERMAEYWNEEKTIHYISGYRAVLGGGWADPLEHLTPLFLIGLSPSIRYMQLGFRLVRNAN